MCGRARCALRQEAYAALVGADQLRDPGGHYSSGSNNLAPAGWLPVIRLNKDQQPEVMVMQWGLVPSFHKQGEPLDHWKMFNARCETIHSSPVFRRLIARKRCVVLLNGFYEWKSDAGGKKQPYYIYMSSFASSPTSAGPGSPTKPAHPQTAVDEFVLPVAGLYDVATGNDGMPLHTVTLITCDSCPSLTWLHDRMPVLLDSPESIDAWLGAPLPHDCGLYQAMRRSRGAHGADAHSAPATTTQGTNSASPTHAATAGSNSPAHLQAASPHKATQQRGSEGKGQQRDEKDVKTDAKGGDGSAQPTSVHQGQPHTSHASHTPHTSHMKEEGGTEGSPGDATVGVKYESEGARISHTAEVKDEGHHQSAGSVKDEGEGGSRELKTEAHGGGETGPSVDGTAESEDVLRLIRKVCIPFRGTLAWHPVTPAMSKMTYQGTDAYHDVRTRKGSIMSFFAAKPTPQATTTTSTIKPTPRATTAGAAKPTPQSNTTSPAKASQQHTSPVKGAHGKTQAPSPPAVSKPSKDGKTHTEKTHTALAQAPQGDGVGTDTTACVANADDTPMSVMVVDLTQDESEGGEKSAGGVGQGKRKGGTDTGGQRNAKKQAR